jgi:hypothetical protein
MSKVYTQAELDAAVAAASAKNRAAVTVKLNPKGTISVTGIGRWPASYYKSQWEVILSPKVTAQVRAAMALAPDKPADSE